MRASFLPHGLLLAASLGMTGSGNAAQSTNPQKSIDGAWQADVQRNMDQADAAAAEFRKHAPATGSDDATGTTSEAPPGGRHGGHEGGMGDGGGMGGGRGGMGGGMGSQGGGRSGRHGAGQGGPSTAGGQRPLTPQAHLQEGVFNAVAPMVHGLVVARMGGTVIIANRDGGNQILIPLDSAPVELDGGVWATSHDAKGVLELQLESADGFHAQYRYLPDPADPGALHVQIETHARGGTAVYKVERAYQQMAAR